MKNRHDPTSGAVRARRPRPWLLAAALSLALPAPAMADAVTDWNALAGALSAPGNAPPQQFRILAMTHVAIHDALNAIDPRYRTYAPSTGASATASPDAAVARAAADVLRAAVPANQANINTAYNAYIAALPACPAAAPTCVADGEAAGAAAAAAIVAMRTLDGAETPHLPYTLAADLGVYQTTPGVAFAQFGNWGNLTPFAIGNAAQFRSGRTDFFHLNGRTYTDDYNEVKDHGSAAVRGAAPDSYESQVARYMPGGGGNPNAVARAVAATRSLDLWDNARLFALMNMAVNDSLIVTFALKYRHNFWRPYTAIRWADDGNPDTAPDPAFTTYIPTPPYPDYPCGLPSTIGSAAQVLRDVLGTDELPYSLTAAGVTRSYQRLTQLEAESVDARVFGGIHFRSGCVASIEQSRKVGSFVVHTQLKPL